MALVRNRRPAPVAGRQTSRWTCSADRVDKLCRQAADWAFRRCMPDDVTVLCGDLALGHVHGGSALPDFLFIDGLARQKGGAQGQPRLLVEHCDEGLAASSQRTACTPWIYSTTTAASTATIAIVRHARLVLRGGQGRGEHDKKIMLREVGRLEASLKAAGDRTKLVFLHYPPKYLRL